MASSPAAEGHVAGQPRGWLRAEGLLTFVAATALYAYSGAAWLWYAVLFLAPDLSFLGYLAGPRVGATAYNAMHSYVGPLAASLALLILNVPAGIVLIWFAHIGFDRTLGYGLKYPSAFQDTHMGRIGRARYG
jgi:hypothetical protein